MERLKRAITLNWAETAIGAEDKRLRGRTYAITFDRVWNAALELADGGLPRWTARWWDDEKGAIQASSKTLVFRFIDDVMINIRLDENGQTRLDMRSSSRVGTRGDLGMNARRITKFCRALDKKLGAKPEHILDPTAPPTDYWLRQDTGMQLAPRPNRSGKSDALPATALDPLANAPRERQSQRVD